MLSAVIDAGFNSFRLVLYQVFPNGTFRIIGSLKSFVRIGEGLEEGEPIGESKIREAEEAFSIFKKIIDKEKVEDVKIVATSAFRYATNGNEIAQKLSKLIGYEMKIISGEEEGRFSGIGILNTLPVSNGILFELGGGSLELIEVNEGNIGKVYQLPIGALKLLNYPEKEIRKIVKDQLSTLSLKRQGVLVGSGGNVRALAKMDLKLSSYPTRSIHGYSISLKQISKYSSLLPTLDVDARASLPGIGKERAFTIHTASIIIDELMKYFNAEKLIVSAYGMREGVLTEGRRLNRESWLYGIAYFNALEPPIQIFKDIIDSVGGKYSFYIASSAYLSLIFKMSGYLNPYEACYRFIKNSVLPGFLLEEALIIGFICKSVYNKVKKKHIKFLSEKISKKELLSYGNIVKNAVEKYVNGVRL
ncbi:Ppx/GppA phosphatase family protein [Sulfurisphaera ohwakuensis]|uniref:Exopolyphosphatase/guanosine-5'-triphosphate, 3'-diphosphate pyrophosphatase n=1 Tax=Sulfurisphaera ohwakuensis TaxID=69656 RepID=A0A650CHL2_SULOH|nr:Ppx/GppA phosphatase family protein [Sulfurisphaera ohwakuensis]MBB5255075.1 exopolyphosphatase/guanosine-5'-triphosphate,3'-diphosphate pyrophosphatase [Sulfurisphaera ohwakuensis]QGR17256.1 Ppx/GppA family phosphatase [Sulfurisphaera ohwakuensis]